MIYNLLKNLITAGKYEKVDMANKLDVFYTFDRIEVEQYRELYEIVTTEV